MSFLVIPVFISHQGCPHRCIFCDQHTITGNNPEGNEPVGSREVSETIAQWLDHARAAENKTVQVGFYGGSFTGLPLARQKELLGAVRPYIESGRVGSIRISTRPDYIDETVLALLKEHLVSTVELGIQSLDQEVLENSARGHSVAQAENAIRLLKGRGFTVGAQIMCGLPGDSTVKLTKTAGKVAELGPDFVRIYPTVVIRGSGLEKLYRRKGYRPLSLQKALVLAGRLKEIFARHDIRVVRLGLHPSRELKEKVVAGPYHPAFGELVASRALFRQARRLLRGGTSNRPRQLAVAAADESAFRGPGNVNIRRLEALGLLDGVKVVFNKGQDRNTLIVD